MKHIILILSVCLSFALWSCMESNIPDNPDKEDNGKCSVTFALSKSDDSNFNIVTKAQGSLVPNGYTVVFYLFKNDTESNQYQLVQKETVYPPLYTIENLEKKSQYKYVFAATKDENASVLDAIDFSKGTTKTGTIVPSTTLARVEDGNILENCFISYVEDGNPLTYTNDETIVINKDLEIYGCGSLFIPGQVSSTPIDVIMERQFGVVEFIYTDAQVGDKLTCSFSSDYYRLYLSQMIRDDITKEYTSSNLAMMPFNGNTYVHGNMGINDYKTGDYYSALGILKSKAILPVFKKEKTLAAGQNSIQVYVPYTTATTVGTEVDNTYKANYISFTGTGGPVNSLMKDRFKGSVFLRVEKTDNTIKEYKREGNEAPFPIYRNAKTTFTTVGNDYMQISIGNGGINIDDDNWDGD